MNELRFEWDDEKAKSNFRKHGVFFDEAATVFYDPLYIEDYDDAHSDEDRFKLIGKSSNGNLLVVIYTDRAGTIRIIGTRQTTTNERRYYESENRST